MGFAFRILIALLFAGQSVSAGPVLMASRVAHKVPKQSKAKAPEKTEKSMAQASKIVLPRVLTYGDVFESLPSWYGVLVAMDGSFTIEDIEMLAKSLKGYGANLNDSPRMKVVNNRIRTGGLELELYDDGSLRHKGRVIKYNFEKSLEWNLQKIRMAVSPRFSWLELLLPMALADEDGDEEEDGNEEDEDDDDEDKAKKKKRKEASSGSEKSGGGGGGMPDIMGLLSSVIGGVMMMAMMKQMNKKDDQKTPKQPVPVNLAAPVPTQNAGRPGVAAFPGNGVLGRALVQTAASRVAADGAAVSSVACGSGSRGFSMTQGNTVMRYSESAGLEINRGGTLHKVPADLLTKKELMGLGYVNQNCSTVQANVQTAVVARSGLQIGGGRFGIAPVSGAGAGSGQK